MYIVNTYFKVWLLSEFPSSIQALPLSEGNNFAWFTAIDSAPRIVLNNLCWNKKQKIENVSWLLYYIMVGSFNWEYWLLVVIPVTQQFLGFL